MFEDKKRPLFNSASISLELNRISHKDYETFIQNAAHLRWGSTLSGTTLNTLLVLADRHTHFVYRLCHELWRRNAIPSVKTVGAVWNKLLHRERYQADNTLLALTLIQRSALQAIAQSPTESPLARKYLNQFNIAGSTTKKSIEALMAKDLVRLSRDGRYEVIDPLIKAALTSTDSQQS